MSTYEIRYPNSSSTVLIIKIFSELKFQFITIFFFKLVNVLNYNTVFCENL